MSVPSRRETVLWLIAVRCASSPTRAPAGSSASASSSASARSTDASVRPSSLIARGTLQPPPVCERLVPIGNALAGRATYHGRHVLSADLPALRSPRSHGLRLRWRAQPPPARAPHAARARHLQLLPPQRGRRPARMVVPPLGLPGL